MAYESRMAQVLVDIAELTYTQYANGASPPGNTGQITPPSGYLQVPGANFTASELSFGQIRTHFGASDFSKFRLNDFDTLRKMIKGFLGMREVYFGFVLKPDPNAKPKNNCNIVALRGTQSIEEWMLNVDMIQVPLPQPLYQDNQLQNAKVHLGFLLTALLLAGQVLDVAQNELDMSLPCYLTGHSLGGALAVLLGLLLKTHHSATGFYVYNYGAPRIGGLGFANAYNTLMPETYRIVNLADVVPMLPPDKSGSLIYESVGDEWSFLNQTGDFAKNHTLGVPQISGNKAQNYCEALTNGVVVDVTRSYPVKGL